jgi:hypothetical protein
MQLDDLSVEIADQSQINTLCLLATHGTVQPAHRTSATQQLGSSSDCTFDRVSSLFTPTNDHVEGLLHKVASTAIPGGPPSTHDPCCHKFSRAREANNKQSID